MNASMEVHVTIYIHVGCALDSVYMLELYQNSHVSSYVSRDKYVIFSLSSKPDWYVCDVKLYFSDTGALKRNVQVRWSVDTTYQPMLLDNHINLSSIMHPSHYRLKCIWIQFVWTRMRWGVYHINTVYSFVNHSLFLLSYSILINAYRLHNLSWITWSKECCVISLYWYYKQWDFLTTFWLFVDLENP